MWLEIIGQFSQLLSTLLNVHIRHQVKHEEQGQEPN